MADRFVHYARGRTTLRAVAATLGAAAALIAVSAADAQQTRVRTGTLRCSVAPGVAVIVGSRSLACSFRSTHGSRESYSGRLTKVGFNFGVTGRGTLVWGVFEPAGRHGSLAGAYVGATGEASLGPGIGANALIGGFNDNVALQPLSVQGQTGVNVALGGAALELRRLR
jgi:hypothetical protein